MKVSATEIDTYRDCRRKWAWRWIEGVQAPQAPSARLGTRVHQILERWLRDGEEPNALEVMELDSHGRSVKYYPGQIAQAGLHLLPPPRVAETESRFDLELLPGIRFKGSIDFRYTSEGRTVIGDHKTTSDLKWSKTEDDLLYDIQAQVYARVGFQETFDDSLFLRWIYYTTRTHRAKPVGVFVTREHNDAAFAAIAETVEEIRTTRLSGKRALDLAPTVSACEKYGGCPHQDRCNLTFQDRLEGIEAMNVAERIKEELEKRKAAGAPVAAMPAPPPPPAPAAAPARPQHWIPGDPMNDVQKMLKEMGKPIDVIAAGADNAPPAGTAVDWSLYPWPGETPPPPPPAPPVAPESGTINPPEAPASAPATPEESPRAPAAETTEGDGDLDRAALKAEAVAKGLVPENTKLGAKKLKELLGGTPAPKAPAPAPKAPASATVTPGVLPKASSSNRLGFTLFVDAIPIGFENVIHFGEILEPVCEVMAKETGISDYRLEEYGKGPGRLSACVEAYLRDKKIGEGWIVVVSSSTPEGGACIERLQRLAGPIVRGVR